MENKTRIYEEGNYDLRIAPVNTIGDGYDEPVTVINGLMKVDITFSQTETNTPADDITDYLSRRSPVKGEGTITFAGLTKAMYKLLYNNIVDSNGVIVVGRGGKPKKVGISFKNTCQAEEGSSENMFTINNATFSVPNINTQSIAEDDTTIRDFALSVKCNPFNYTTSEGKKDRVTYSILNSVDDEAIYEKVKETIYIPDTDTGSLANTEIA